jgi:hypothetical protein
MLERFNVMSNMLIHCNDCQKQYNSSHKEFIVVLNYVALGGTGDYKLCRSLITRECSRALRALCHRREASCARNCSRVQMVKCWMREMSGF